MIFSVVLYDAVAGGAGHVRRIVTADGQAFQRVLAKAISVVDNCDCDSSCYRCLRNYYNQKIHDNLNRNQASAYRWKRLNKIFSPCHSRGKIFWYARCDSNARPSESESDTLSNWATGTYSAYLLYRVFAAFARGNKKNKKIFKICEKSCWHFANKVIR